MTKKINDVILTLSDLHIPYHHVDSLEFLTAIKKKYKPTRTVCIGDECDKHALSFYDSDPDLPSAGDELIEAIEYLEEFYELFPSLDIVDSNHGSMLYRRGKHHGIPRKYLLDYGDVLEAPPGWKWTHDLIIRRGKQEIYFHHGISKDGLKLAKERGICVVQGHYHTEFNIKYCGTPNFLLWSMQVGCLIDKEALAFAYDKNNLGRPIIGTGIIIDGLPKLLPMTLKKNGRWNGCCP